MMLPVGGGGLSAGVTRYFREQGRDARFIFCEPAGAPSLEQSLETGQRMRLDKVDNFVEGPPSRRSAGNSSAGSRSFRRMRCG